MLFAMVGCSTGNSPDENGPGTEIDPDIYLYNSALSINLFGNYEQWWEGPSVTDSSDAEKTGMHGLEQSISVDLPPMSTIYLKKTR